MASSENPSPRGQLSPASAARLRYSLTVSLLIVQALALDLFERPASCFSRRLSLILRMDNLLCAIFSSSLRKRHDGPKIPCHPASLQRFRILRKSGRNQPES